MLHFTVTVYTDSRGKNTVHHTAAGNDRAGAHDRVDGHPHAAALLGEDEVGGRLLRDAGANGPLQVIQVELGNDGDEVHVGFVVGIERADVAPVADLLVVDVAEIVGDDAGAVEQA